MTDPEIRVALIRYLYQEYDGEPELLVVEELNVCGGKSRVDLVMASDHLHGFEIKSRVDTLSRLSGQIEDYQAVFERLTVVTGVNHLTGVLSTLPSWCGIMLASWEAGLVQLESFREAKANPNRRARTVAELLWRDEALAILESRGLDWGVRSKTRPVIWDRVAESLSVEEISQEVCSAFRNRPTSWRNNMDRKPRRRKSRRRRRKRTR